ARYVEPVSAGDVQRAEPPDGHSPAVLEIDAFPTRDGDAAGIGQGAVAFDRQRGRGQRAGDVHLPAARDPVAHDSGAALALQGDAALVVQFAILLDGGGSVVLPDPFFVSATKAPSSLSTTSA